MTTTFEIQLTDYKVSKNLFRGVAFYINLEVILNLVELLYQNNVRKYNFGPWSFGHSKSTRNILCRVTIQKQGCYTLGGVVSYW